MDTPRRFNIESSTVQPFISVVIPAYNEEEGIRSSVLSVMAAAKQAGDIPIEIIIVNDGSRDRTAEAVRRLESEFPLVCSVDHPRNLGFGASFKDGIKKARGEKICLFPGDNATSIYSIKQVFLHCREADVVIGYFMDTEARSRFRNALSTIFNQTYCITFGVHVKYLQGSPCYSADRLRRLAIRSDGLSILAEINVKLLRSGASFLEVDGYYNSEVKKTSLSGIAGLTRAALHAAWNYLGLIYEVRIKDRGRYSQRPRRIRPADAISHQGS